MFREPLSRLVQSVDGALGAAVMNRHGVVVESVHGEGLTSHTVDGLGELGPVFDQLDGMRDLFNPGPYRSCIMRSQNRVVFICPLNADYLALFWVSPSAIIGKAKFKLRLVAPELKAQL